MMRSAKSRLCLAAFAGPSIHASSIPSLCSNQKNLSLVALTFEFDCADLLALMLVATAFAVVVGFFLLERGMLGKLIEMWNADKERDDAE